MKRRPFPYLQLLLVLIVTGVISSCGDLFEASIKDSVVILEAPAEPYVSTSYTVNFWWDKVNNALSYHLQVVTPGFASPAALVLDTVIQKNTFSYTFNPGNYQWRVMAQNGSSQTAYAGPRDFSVAASSIKAQSVQLTSPANGSLTNQSNTTFQWSALYGATKYQLEIDTNNFTDESSVLYNQTVPGQQISFTFPKDQTYQWRVRAQNDTAQAQWSAIYQVTCDRNPPAQVTLVSPANATTLTLPVSLGWNPVNGAVKYKLYIYQSDGTTLLSSSFPMALTTTSYSFNQGSSGNTFYWTVTAVDAAGNESLAPAARSFILQ